MKANIVKDKSYSFALKIIEACQRLSDSRNYVLSRQLLRSGTSIGANIEEALHAESRADFIHKLSIAQKEAAETHYWLRLFRDSSILPEETAFTMLSECEELRRIIASIIKTTKASAKECSIHNS
ncbi:MAG TPA: four helix bundle protein [Flavipsychrobacter sp.]|nr:four helix bundle protein [Flavipsychrobacter sp.]